DHRQARSALKIAEAARTAITPQSAPGGGASRIGGAWTASEEHMHIVPAQWIRAGGRQAAGWGVGVEPGARYSHPQPDGVHTSAQSGLQTRSGSFWSMGIS